MKKMRCFISVVLSVAMVLSCFVAFADGTTTGKLTDVTSDSVYYNAVKTLNAMGVINGYEDSTFRPDQNVTRAEFTAMLMRTLKLGAIGSTSAAELPFTDIDDNNGDYNWAIPNINTAYAKGVINGYEDNTFRPSDNVAYEEAIKMIMCTLGYTASVDATPWYANYISIAAQKGVTKVASQIGAAETPASRACIAQLLYDSLDVRIVENNEVTDKTILNDYLNYEKTTGIIYSNDVTSIESQDVNLRENEIMIYAKEPNTNSYELHTYITTDTNLKNYLGYEVDFYYTTSGSTRTIALCVLNDAEPLVISASDVETGTSSNSQLKYYMNKDDNKEKVANISSDNVVIYNGKLYGNSRNASRFDVSMIPLIGQVKLIDSDNDRIYDVIDITAYDVYYVSSKSSTSYEIVDNVIQPAENKTLKLDKASDANLSIVDKNGKELEFSSIAVGNIICYTKSNGGTPLKKAIVLSDKVTGTISAVQNDTITISGKDYYISNAAPWLNGGKLDEAPQNQDSGTYYLDLNGDVVAYTKNATSVSTYYGFVIAYAEDKESFDGDVTFRILNSAGSTQYVKTYRSTSVDGEPCSKGTDVLNALRDAADNGKSGAEGIQQVIKYTTKTVSGETVLDKVYTATPVDKGGEIVTDKLTTLSTITRNDVSEYSTSSTTITCNGAKVNLSNATVFVVPEDGVYNNFKKSTVSSVFNSSGNYKIEVFDVSATNVPKVVVAYGADSSKKITSSSPVYVITDKTQAMRNDEDTWKLAGYKAGTSFSEFDSMWISQDSDKDVVEALEKGDIFRVGTDFDGDALFVADDEEKTHIIYQVDKENEFGIFGKINSSSDSGILIGSIVAKDEGSLSIAPENLTKDSEGYNESELQLYNVKDFNSAQILKYDNTGKKLEIIEIPNDEYQAAIDALATYDDGMDPSKVLIYVYKKAVKLLVILPE